VTLTHKFAICGKEEKGRGREPFEVFRGEGSTISLLRQRRPRLSPLLDKRRRGGGKENVLTVNPEKRKIPYKFSRK